MFFADRYKLIEVNRCYQGGQDQCGRGLYVLLRGAPLVSCVGIPWHGSALLCVWVHKWLCMCVCLREGESHTESTRVIFKMEGSLEEEHRGNERRRERDSLLSFCREHRYAYHRQSERERKREREKK